MPNVRHAGRVWYCDESRPSGRLLGRALAARGYQGSPINWGVAAPDGMPALPLNAWDVVAQASNKRMALLGMQARGVPVPEQYSFQDALERVRGGNQPIVARTERHHGGSGFWLCRRRRELREAAIMGATHFMEYISPAREFRVHVAFGESIKLTEKMYLFSSDSTNPTWLHGDHRNAPSGTRNFQNGWRFRYPQDFGYRPTLRAIAKDAVRSLGLDFGAVDVLWDHGRVTARGSGFFVTEVNTAPDLRSQSDILERYTEAFVSHWRGE